MDKDNNLVWIDSLRVCAALTVVLLHVSTYLLSRQEVGSFEWWFCDLFDSASRVCVPLFVMISGALLLDGGKNESLSLFYRKRASRILAPLVFWTVLSIGLLVYLAPEGSTEFSAPNLVKKVLVGSPYYHLWYLYMLLGLYLFVPFFRKAVAALDLRGLGWFSGIGLAFVGADALFSEFASVSGDQPFTRLFVPYIPYFFLGYFLRQVPLVISGVVWKTVFLMAMVVTAVGYYMMAVYASDRDFYFYGPNSVTSAAMSISAFMMFRRAAPTGAMARLVSCLAPLTFGIYLVHPYVLTFLSIREAKADWCVSAFYLPLICLFIYAISAGVAWIFLRLPVLRRCV
jgi:surface polysaccharide O-acyltransferase-like enzyme